MHLIENKIQEKKKKKENKFGRLSVHVYDLCNKIGCMYFYNLAHEEN